MRKIHWAGGVELPRSRMRAGWPCCCSGLAAYNIKEEGNMTNAQEQVTCKKCQKLLRKAGLLEESSD